MNIHPNYYILSTLLYYSPLLSTPFVLILDKSVAGATCATLTLTLPVAATITSLSATTVATGSSIALGALCCAAFLRTTHVMMMTHITPPNAQAATTSTARITKMSR